MDKSNEFFPSVLCNCESKPEFGCSNKINFTDAKAGLKEMKSKCPGKLIMSHLKGKETNLPNNDYLLRLGADN